mgnify:CR=1 FL=1
MVSASVVVYENEYIRCSERWLHGVRILEVVHLKPEPWSVSVDYFKDEIEEAKLRSAGLSPT